MAARPSKKIEMRTAGEILQETHDPALRDILQSAHDSVMVAAMERRDHGQGIASYAALQVLRQLHWSALKRMKTGIYGHLKKAIATGGNINNIEALVHAGSLLNEALNTSGPRGNWTSRSDGTIALLKTHHTILSEKAAARAITLHHSRTGPEAISDDEARKFLRKLRRDKNGQADALAFAEEHWPPHPSLTKPYRPSRIKALIAIHLMPGVLAHLKPDEMHVLSRVFGISREPEKLEDIAKSVGKGRDEVKRSVENALTKITNKAIIHSLKPPAKMGRNAREGSRQ